MPLLNKKKVPLAAAIPYEPKRKRKEVWYLQSTNEVFDNYEEYINKLSLYHQAIWECEVTGRQNLTYEQALESERMEGERAEFKFSEVLRRMILNRVQFQTVSLDDLVDDIMNHFKNNYLVGEVIQCTLNNNEYSINELSCFEKDTYIVSEGRSQMISNESIQAQQPAMVDPARQSNGRLRFPEAFVNPSYELDSRYHSVGKMYRVQLIDEKGRSLEEYVRTIGESSIRRERESFNSCNVQCFIRECFYRDNYMGAPWLVRPNIAETYSIDITLPEILKEAQGNFIKGSKRRKTIQAKANEEKLAGKRLKKEESLLQKAKLKEEKERQKEERKRQGAVKYPLEDIDLPIYRKDPMLNWLLIDMSPQKYDAKEGIIPYPTGGRSSRPIPHKESTIPLEHFDSFLSVWSFLTVFAEPLKVSAYSVDEFENALLHNTHQPKAKVLIEYNACLLNVLIRERDDDTPNELINGDVAEGYIEKLEEQEKEMEDDSSSEDEAMVETKKIKEKKVVLPLIERGWQDKEQLRIGQRWDHKELRSNSERRGWETSLIGCLNNVATPELIPDLDEILQHLVPRINSTAAERERQYPALSLKQKLDILEFLVNTVNESNLIKNYMDYCQEQISEYRKQKIEINKGSKALSLKRAELDKRDRAEKETKKETDEESASKETGEESASSDDSADSGDESGSNSEENDSAHEKNPTRQHRQLSKQKKQKTKPGEKEDEEHAHKKIHAGQQENTKAKGQEQKNERQKLEEEDRALKKKEEHLERCMRRYMTLRIRPLGKDRFYNQYLYLDNIGVSNTCGSGRLYVRSPSDSDIQMMMERDYLIDLPERHCGYGGGRWFILRLMKDQGLEEESEWLKNRMDELKSDHPSHYKGWWKYYSEPEEIEQLLSWLNPKGVRELKLKNEISKQQSNITDSIKKRTNVFLAVEPEPSKRSTRTKTLTKS